MNFNDHSKLNGVHAPFPASQPYWLGKTFEENVERYNSKWIPTIGTVSHAFAQTMISKRIKLNKSDMKLYRLYLLDNKTQCIPCSIVDGIDLESIFLNLIPYINDAIGYRMSPEVILYYSSRFFGTADAIAFDKNMMLRIHDLKTGRIQAKMEQLLVYAALFCLEYNIRPGDILTELRIYQNGEITYFEPTVDDILPVMDQIQTQDRLFEEMLREEE